MPIASSNGKSSTASRTSRKTPLSVKIGSTKRRKATNHSAAPCSLSMVVIYSVVASMFLYVLAVVLFTRTLSTKGRTATQGGINSNTGYQEEGGAPPRLLNSEGKKNPNYIPNVYSRDQWGDQKPPTTKVANVIKPQLLRKPSADHDAVDPKDREDINPEASIPKNRILTAYLEPIDRSSWKNKPLPTRTSTAEDLKMINFPQLNSCRKLPEQWPVDNYPEDDPFLPWIHDVFPSHDGTTIQFVAQNRRRCHTGTTLEDTATLNHTEPQVALFQHVAVQRFNETGSSSFRYRLMDHEHADEDGMETRFICRFQPSGEETLSVYNFNYEWASYRKKIRQMFNEHGRNNKQIHTSQLIFQCPVPKSLVEIVRTGASVKGDYATLFVDLIPIRTPPRYGPPAAFFPPYYKEFQWKGEGAFIASQEWGSDHVLPLVENSGRWANIPICKPSLLTYGKQEDDATALAIIPDISQASEPVQPIKQHNVASCIWASTGYATRGNRFAINDGQRRLLEWITYHKLIGVDHFFLYDNSGAFSDDPSNSLHPIAELFPDDVTVIDWPSQVCNNNPNK